MHRGTIVITIDTFNATGNRYITDIFNVIDIEILPGVGKFILALGILVIIFYILSRISKRNKRLYHNFIVFCSMGIVAELWGILYASHFRSVTTTVGILFKLDAIAAVFTGGASPSGGIGKVIGSIVGVFVIRG